MLLVEFLAYMHTRQAKDSAERRPKNNILTFTGQHFSASVRTLITVRQRLTHTRTPFNGPFSRTTRVSRHQKGKLIWILPKQETMSGSGFRWAICKSAHRSRQITIPAPHHSVILQAGCPSCRPTNGVKALSDKD